MAGGGGGGGSDYWPGFVDALTNVVIAMVFVIVVLAISLSFAMQMIAKKLTAQVESANQKSASAEAALKHLQSAIAGPDNAAVAAANLQGKAAPVQNRVHVEGGKATPLAGDIQLSTSNAILRLDFEPDAMTLDEQAAKKLDGSMGALQEALSQAPAGSRIRILAQGKDMYFSDNQRAAFVRAMAVRNFLISRGFHPEQLTARVDTETELREPQVSLQLVNK